jgi:hypothetical protein
MLTFQEPFRSRRFSFLLVVVISVVLLAILALSLTGCGGGQSSLTSTASAAPATASTPAPSEPAPTQSQPPPPTETAPPAAAPVATPTPPPAETPPNPPPAEPPPAPAPPASYRFVAWGDTRGGTGTLAALSREIIPLNPVFTVYAGDGEPAGFTSSGTTTFINALNGNANNGLSEKTFFARGNHDAAVNTAGWQAYYDFGGVARTVGGTNFSALVDGLTYSFDYKNSHFVAVDVAGDANRITAGQIAWLDSDLTAAEARGLTHAFIFFHGPIYCVESVHCPGLTGMTGSLAPQGLIDVLNKHAIVSATIHGHEHVLAYVHVDNTRLTTLTRSFEQIIVGTAGAPIYSCDRPIRTDWCDTVNGYATIDVVGPEFTVEFRQQGVSAPIRTLKFSKP